jgi:DNA-binding beta-propeller fold protein YncE
VVGPAVAVGAPGHGVGGIAVGEGAVWAGGWDRRGGVVLRLDQQSGEPVETVRVPHGGGDVAVGQGAVWTAGVVCVGRHPEDPEDVCLTEPRVSRIDPAGGRVAATIGIPLPPGVGRDTAHTSAVAVADGAVWVGVSWDAWTGEVLRIDPRTNAIAARIPTGGFVGELRLGAGSVWVLSHREYTDETKVKGASLRRIDPSTNAVVATPIREELTYLGGDLIPPVLAAGDDAVWVTSPTAANPRQAFRVDTETNQVAREQLPVERFYPVAVDADAIWFIGSTGQAATLARLDPRTLEQTSATELPVSAVRAARDPSTSSFWIASLVNRYDERARVVRVRMR